MRMTRQQVERMIRYEDEEVLVVHKPPFLAVETRDARQQDLVSILMNRRVTNGEAAFIGIVHRLDQPVEGLMVLAKTKQAAALLSAGLREGDFSKEYLAVVHGVTEQCGTLVHTLKKDGRTNTSAVVPVGAAGGKEARLSYERLAAAETASLLRIRLDTGRHHQIRVQLAAIGHPILGDGKYGKDVETCRASDVKRAEIDGERPEIAAQKEGADVSSAEKAVKMVRDQNARSQSGQPLALCSCRLVFTHPRTGEVMEFQTTPTGAGFEELKGALG